MAPVPVKATTVINTATTVVNLLRNMDLNTLSVRVATSAETTPAATDCLVAKPQAALTVDDTSPVGMPADAASWDSTTANAPADDPRPYRASRRASIVRARASRL